MGRLIDADKLIDRFKQLKGVDSLANMFITDVIKEINRQPTEENPILAHGEWIPCSVFLPEEHDSIFKKFKGTDKWRNAMFEKMSDNVNVTVEFEDGARMSMKGYTVDGKWKPDTAVKCKVIAWMPIPYPYKPEGEKL